MKISIQRAKKPPIYTPSLWTLLTQQAFSGRWKGKKAPLVSLEIGKPQLLFFRSEGCRICGEIDIFVGQICSGLNIKLIVIDLSSGESDIEVYDNEELMLDVNGEWNKMYSIAIYPTFVLIDKDGHILLREVDVKVPVDEFKEYFKKILNTALGH